MQKSRRRQSCLTTEGTVVYRGKINDRYAGYGDRRNQVRTHFLRDALDSVLEGKPIKIPKTEALGMFD